jgi:beta-lactam-binding protein with PASTA domain
VARAPSEISAGARGGAIIASVPAWTTELILGVFAAAAVAGCGAQPSATPDVARGATTIVVPRVVGLDLPNAIAELDYLQMIPALVDRHRRPMFVGAGGQPGCRVIRQRPRARTEVAEGELTVTVTIVVGC